MPKTWKRTEKRHAKDLGAERVSTLKRGEESADSENSWLSIESKERKSVPAYLIEFMEQAERNANGKLPIVVLHKLGQRYDSDLVFMRFKDFKEWFGDEDKSI